MLNCGFATLVDSVVAVKKLVYDDKIVTLEVLKAALDANWEGYEDLRRLAVSAPKYGNGDYEADGIADALAAYFANSVNGRENARGGVYKAIMHTAMMFKLGRRKDRRYARRQKTRRGDRQKRFAFDRRRPRRRYRAYSFRARNPTLYLLRKLRSRRVDSSVGVRGRGRTHGDERTS